MPAIQTGRALLDAKKLLVRAGLRYDMRYADLGAGTLGHFVFPASDLVGIDGKVFAVDILKSVLEAIESRIRLETVHNIETLWGNIEVVGGVKIESNSLDLLSLINISSTVVKSPVVADEVKRLLKKNGQILVVDWKPEAGSMLIPKENRVNSNSIRTIFEERGLEFVEEFDAGPHHWGLIFKDPS